MIRCVAALGFLLLFSATPLFAQSEPISDAEREKIWQAADAASVKGPSDVVLGEQAKLHLPESMIYVPARESAEIMRMWGNSTGNGFHGIIFPKGDAQHWTIVINHTAEGYVKDDDAKTWNADELLQSLKDGTEQQNLERVKLGIPELEILGWIQQPAYDAAQHRLVWSIRAKDKGGAVDQLNSVNYNTYALGREGYFEVDLLSNEKEVEQDKAAANAVLAALDYNEGKRYSDFNAATDHIAEYGLAALIGGIAAKKLGLLAVVGVFLAKFAKIIIAAVAVAGGGLFKMFRRKSSDS